MNLDISNPSEDSGILRFENKSLGEFLLLQCIQLAVFCVVTYTLFGDTWNAQLAFGPILIAVAFLLMHLVASFFEFFFHRYVLHLKVIPFLKQFAEKHGRHHGLTPVRKVSGGNLLRVENTFPILKEEQRPHSVFPWYALMVFALVFTPPIFFLQWLLPALPMLFGGYLTVFVSYVGYEVLHGYEHRSYEKWWKPRIERKYFGAWWKKFYSFHLTHHANTRCNEAIAGFLGMPLPDWILGTYKKPSQLLLDGTMVVEEDFTAPRPSWPIRLLDKIFGVAV